MNTPLRSGLSSSLHSSLHSQPVFDSLPSRLIPTFNGTTQYGTLDTPIVANAGDTIEIKFATTSTAYQSLCDSDDATNRTFIQFTTPGVINWDALVITALTLDGVAAIDEVTAAPVDGKVHTIIATLAAGAKIGVIGSVFGLVDNFFNGQIFSVKYTNNTTGEVVNYVFDSGSTVEQYARGSTTLKVTLTAFTAANWSRYTLQRNIVHDGGTIVEAWIGDDLVVNGTFDADTDWTKGTGWSISGGSANGDGVNVQILSQMLTITTATPYFVTQTVTGRTTGQLRAQLGGTFGAFRSTDNTFKEIITTINDISPLEINGLATPFNGSVDDVIVNHLLEVA